MTSSKSTGRRNGTLIFLDTHVVAWLYLGDLKRLPFAAREAIKTHELVISPMVLVELEYLYEIRRTAEPARAVIEALERDLGLQVCDRPFEQVARRALIENWTRDPFDRLIVSQAALHEATLVTRDRKIRQHYSRALWSDPIP